MANRIDEVTIVGGGTAGWVTALMLTTFLNERRDGPGVAITLIESPNIPTVGVGEATVPGMRRLLRRLSINETEYFRRCNVTFKCGVRFENWSVDADGAPVNFVHPFDGVSHISGKNPGYHFQKFGRADGAADFVEALLPNQTIIDNYLGPRQTSMKDYTSTIGYSYHLDASLFSAFLRDVAVQRGVRHIQDDVVDVRLDERGFVSELQLEQGGSHPIKFVVDCSGFKGLIIDKAMGEPFEPWGKHLLCDRALAVQLEHVDPNHLEVCTSSTALGAGWVWTVPLFTRAGLGYVFSSAFRTDEEARDEFVAHLESRGYKVDHEPRAIGMRVGRVRNAWTKNCVAIGLSGGFVEPLEATAIHGIIVAARQLVANFPDRDVSPALAQRYNRSMGELFDNILEFIVLHYYTSNRTDSPFWLAARCEIDVPDSLLEKLDLYRHVLPATPDIIGTHLFNSWSYLAVLFGKKYFDGVEFPLGESVSLRDWDNFSQKLIKRKQHLLQHLPDHRTLVSHIRNGGEPVSRQASVPDYASQMAGGRPG